MATDPMYALPEEYQTALDEADRKKQLAQMLMAQAARGVTPVQGRIASRTPLFATLANVAQTGIGAWQGSEAAKEANAVKQRFQTDQRTELTGMQGIPELDAIKKGQTSNFPMARELAKTLQTQAEKRRELASGVYSTNGQVPQALATLNGTPVPEPAARQIEEVVESVDPNNPEKKLIRYRTYDSKGMPHLSFQPVGSTATASVHLPGKQDEMVVGQIKENLNERRGKVQAAVTAYSAATQAVDALESGAQAGGGENLKQSIRKAAQAFGVNLPETSGTDQLQQALLQGVLAHAKELRPASDTDLKILQQMVGNAGTDPKALTKALAFAQSMALKDIQGYHDYVGENKKNLNPSIQAMFSGATSGYDMPKTLTGPIAYQMEVVRNLQKQGFDISRLAGPDGKPFDPNSKFSIDPTQGFPGIQNPENPGIAKPPAAPVNPGTLSKKDQARMLELKKLLGITQ